MENLAVSDVRRRRYGHAFATLDIWCRRCHLGPAVADPKLDAKVADYLDALVLGNAQRTEAEYAVAAVRAHHPQYSGRGGSGLPRAERAVRGFRRLQPSRSRYPMPWPLTVATIMALWAQGRRRSALMTMLMQVCYVLATWRSEAAQGGGHLTTGIALPLVGHRHRT